MQYDSFEGSPQAYDVHLDRNVMVPMRDGVKLATNIFLPSVRGRPARGTFPVLVERTPYDKNQAKLHMAGMFLARFGYVVAMQDCRGRFDSEGEFDTKHFRASDEGPDGFDAIEWLAEQPWSNGKVGTIGISQTGHNQQSVAVLRPPSLKSQFIGDCALNNWRSPVRQNGAFSQGIVYRLALRMARHGPEAVGDERIQRLLYSAWRDVAKYREAFPVKRGQTPLAQVPSWEQWYFDAATRSDYDEFWSEPSSSQDETKENWKDVPVCLTTGWYGHHLAQNLEKYLFLSARLTSPVQLFIGPWTHMNIFSASWSGEVEFGPDAYREQLDWVRLRWFDATLKGLRTGMAEASGIEYFVMGGGSGGPDESGRLQHGGRWAASAVWPPQDAGSQALYLHADGSLRDDAPTAREQASRFGFDPKNPVPTVGGNFHGSGGVSLTGEGGPFDQRGRPDLLPYCADDLPLGLRSDVLVFESEPLTEDVEVIGDLKAVLWVSSSAPDTDFTAKLLDVYPPSRDYPEGYAMNLQDAIVRMRYRGGRKQAELIEPHRVYELEVPMQATANVFKRGHRIRLDISSSNSPLYDVNPNTGGPLGVTGPVERAVNTVYHDAERPSRLELQVRRVGGASKA